VKIVRQGLGRWIWLAALAALWLDSPACSARAASPIEDWPQAHGDLPADPAVRFGVLPNGMRYAIMRNTTPKDEVSIRFRVAVGALTESDAQQGVAHFLEHMSFRGSTHVPQAEEWKSLQRLGMAMGADVSAFTTETQTFYQFDLPNARPKTVDTGLMRMREVASELTIAPEAVEAERGTILSEERTRDTPGLRTSRALLAFFYKGQPLGVRLPIGTLDNIEHAQAPLLRDFYRAYYRPERATLIVVGDIDPDTIKAKIKTRFANWRPVGLPGAGLGLGAPVSRGTEAKLVVDPGASRSILVGWLSPYEGPPKTSARAEQAVLDSIALTILNRRFQSMASGANRPFLSAQVVRQDQSRSGRMTLLSVDVDPPHWKSALIAAELVRRQALLFGVSQDEVDREAAGLRTAYQAAADGAATRPTPALANGLLAASDDNAVFASPAQSLALIKQATDGLTAAQVTAALRAAFEGQGPLIFISAPTPIEGGEATIMAAFAEAESSAVRPLAAEAKLEWPYTHFGIPGQVVEQHTAADLGVTTVRFANGVRLSIKPTSFSADQVLVAVKFGEGLLGLPTERSTARWAADGGAFLLGGLKEISYEDLQRVLAAKVFSVGFGTRDDDFVLAGVTRPIDLDVQLQVLGAYLTDPGWRDEAFERVRWSAAPQLNDLAASAEGVLQRDLAFLLHDGDPRWASVTPSDLAFARLDDVKAVLKRPLVEGPIEVTVVGDISVERAISAVAATFGALPPRDPPVPPLPAALAVRFPASTPVPVTLYHKGRHDQAVALIAWPAADFYSNMQRSRSLRMLEQIIQARLFEQLRVAAGASYVPQTSLETSMVFPGYGHIYAYAEVPADKTQLFFDTIGRITADLKAKPVSADELERARQPRVDLFTQSQQTNSYWLNVLIGAASDPRKLDVVRTTIPDLKAVTAADVQADARAYLSDDRAYRLTVLPQPPVSSHAAVQQPATGVATINCAVTAGKLTDCAVVREDPPGRGLGGQARAVAEKLSINPAHPPKTINGRVELKVRALLPAIGS
jgi:zinc protease